MAYELREGQGTLFRNERREKDTHPHARGELLLNGVLYEISAWTKEGRKGKFQSLSVKPKQQRQEHQERSSQPRRDRDDPRTMAGHPDDDMGF